MLVKILFVWLPLAIWLWLALIATIAISHDITLEPFQRAAQTVIAWALPLMGAMLVIELMRRNSPESLPRWLMPGPLESMLLARRPERGTYGPNHPGVDLAKFWDVVGHYHL